MKNTPTRESQRHTSTISSILTKYKIKKTDLPFIGLCLATLVYFTVTEPILITTLGCFSIVFFGLWQIARAVPILERFLSSKIRAWHIISVIIALTGILSVWETPAQAIFLSGLEAFFKQLAKGAAAAGAQAIDDQVIVLIFNLIRGVFLLLVAAASLFAYNQAQQGNDWRPIVVQVGLAFGIVIAIDVVTFLFVGNGTGVT
ncbi:MAG: hypothetical protein F6K58_08535 [Symploca sp. SIO2E9]|nr:hypothetical protein [Symploca sp. SIO2E9]